MLEVAIGQHDHTATRSGEIGNKRVASAVLEAFATWLYH